MKTFFREILIILAIAVAICLLLQVTLQRFIIVEHCMEPNFTEDERILAGKAAYWFHDPERGDVIILHPPFDPELVYIKRIIAIPGDTVEVKDGAVYVNGTKLDEPYIKEAPTYTLSPKELGENEYFVLGDNRNNANDSSKGWTVPRENIIAKVLFSYWPPREWGLAQNYPLEEQLASPTNE